jgi:hypothetical protein
MAASAVVFVRQAERDSASSLVERIAPRGVPTSESVPEGLMLQVHAKGLTLALPSCDTKDYRDKFFLHVYIADGKQRSPAEYVNMDFDLTNEKGKQAQFGGSKICVFDKRFPDTQIDKISVGQFTTPEGRCCAITWSRSFLLDTTLPRK